MGGVEHVSVPWPPSCARRPRLRAGGMAHLSQVPAPAAPRAGHLQRCRVAYGAAVSVAGVPVGLREGGLRESLRRGARCRRWDGWVSKLGSASSQRALGGDCTREYQAFRYEIDPTVRQAQHLLQHVGVSRYAFNWGLEFCKRRLDENVKVPNYYELNKEWNAWKKQNAPWAYDVSSKAPQEAIRDLDTAFRNYWRYRNTPRRFRFPKFRKRGEHDSFRVSQSIKVFPRHVQLPRLGKLKVKEDTKRFSGRALSATISREADRWYVSITVVVNRPDPQPVIGPVVGLDLGLSSFLTVSDGIKIPGPFPAEKALRKLKRLSRAHARKVVGSSNHKKQRLAIARLHRKVKNRREDFLNKTTTTLARTKSVIVVEDLNVQGMQRNAKLSRRIQDSGWSRFRRKLTYKCRWYGSRLIVAPAFYPSSKTCSACGNVKSSLSLSERIYVCEACGLQIDRDWNAAINLERLAAVSSTEAQNACGVTSAG